MRGFTSILQLSILFISGFALVNASAQDEVIEEVVVTASFIDQVASEIGNPLHIVNGDDLSKGATLSLGASLENLLGVSSSDFGSGVGQPIIRGLSGNRVKILNNGMVVRDISGVGPDHINEVDMNNVQQIEVIRGPSSLLYSNGVIGGIVNVVDNTIARKDFEESDFKIGLEGQSVNDGHAYDISYQGNLGGINVSVDYKESDFGNFDIPTGAVLHSEEDHDEDHEEEHDEDHEEEGEHEADLGYLSNSDHESKSGKIGFSKAGDWGYVGISFNRIDSMYGIPFHGEDHEGHDGHGGHDDDEEEEDHEEESHEGERIFTTTDSEVLNLEGSQIIGSGWLKQIDYHFRDTDYLLTEQHAEGEEEHEEDHDDDHHSEGPTLFKNDAREYGAIFDMTNDLFSQKVVINFVEEDISVIGAEAFMNPSENEELTLGYYVSKEFDAFHLDFGVRHDRINRRGSITMREDHDEDHDDDHDEDHDDDHDEDHDEDHEEEHAETNYFDRDINNTSFALSLSRDLTDSLDASLSFSSVERAPHASELYMNGPHLATGRLEVGNSSLESEKANNFDLTLNFEKDGFFGSFTYFRNNVDNYIYLLDETEEEHEEHEEEEEHHGGLILANYLQKDAEFDGYEFEIGKIFELERGDLSLSFARDSVSADFSDGGNIPRIVPDRNFYSVSYAQDDLFLGIDLKDVQEQDDLGVGETVTGGYQMLNLRVSKTFSLSSSNSLNLTLFAKNLLDEVARNHTSFVKDQVPLPGRNFGLKINLEL